MRYLFHYEQVELVDVQLVYMMIVGMLLKGSCAILKV